MPNFAARASVAALLAFAGLAAAPVQAAEPCAMAPADRAWLEISLDEWRRAAREDLGLAEVPMPTIEAIDAHCAFVVPDGDLARMSGTPHDGSVPLPDGSGAPIGPISFAFSRDRFVMSLPSVWREAGFTSEVGLEHLMTGVLLHEIMHTTQSRLATPLLDRLGRETGLGEALSDDALQEKFERVPGYAAAYAEELDALLAAARAPTDAEARGLAAHALHLMRARQSRWLAGRNAPFAQMDDVFLTMEGMGQWLIYRYFRTPQGGGLDAEAALAATRRGQRWWSQDEGLLLYLAIDRLLPGWQQRAFRDPDWRAVNMLAAAVANLHGMDGGARHG